MNVGMKYLKTTNITAKECNVYMFGYCIPFRVQILMYKNNKNFLKTSKKIILLE